jgi:hypothetical protein
MGEDRQGRLRAHRVPGAKSGAEGHCELGALFSGAADGFGFADGLVQAFRQNGLGARGTVHGIIQHESHLFPAFPV